MMDSSIFTPRLLGTWIAVAAIALAASLFFMLHGDSSNVVGPSTYSRSALGYAGIADVLRHDGFTVIRSRGDSVDKAGRSGILVVAEPRFHLPPTREELALMHAPNVLLVLPKWLGRPDRANPAWVGEAIPLSTFISESVLDTAIGTGKVIRSNADVVWSHNDLGVAPHVAAPLQLIQSKRLRPVVASAAGMLIGETQTKGHRLWVVADPDVLNNHALGDGNAAFAVRLFQSLHGSGTIVFDETVHGFTALPNGPAALLLRRPFSYVAILGLLALALLVWAGTGRFGAPEVEPPPLKAGKRDLVHNVAELFRFAGYHPILVRRYVEETLRDTARRLHMPRDLGDAAALDWLRRAGIARGVTADCAELQQRAERLGRSRRSRSPDVSRLPRDAWRWKQEMMHGLADGANHSGGNPRRGPQGRGRSG